MILREKRFFIFSIKNKNLAISSLSLFLFCFVLFCFATTANSLSFLFLQQSRSCALGLEWFFLDRFMYNCPALHTLAFTMVFYGTAQAGPDGSYNRHLKQWPNVCQTDCRRPFFFLLLQTQEMIITGSIWGSIRSEKLYSNDRKEVTRAL